MRKMTYLIISIFSMMTFGVMAQSTEKEASRPKVALVLAGGGAKGAAHIGVLKALEELRVPVDYITGTSMGSFVGGLYATGMSAEEIETYIDTVDWNSGYRDRVDRSQRKVQDKEYEDRYQLTTDLGLRWGEIRGTKGIVQGQGMLKLLRETAGNLPPFQSFDQLAIPYRSVATDIVNLEPVIIGDGYLVDAMMASMSVPGALPPYKLDGKLLVDGGVTNNMPVDVARELGADIVIAVDISTEYKNEEDFTNLFSVADQLSNYLVRSTTNHQAETLTADDYFLRPKVGKMETTEFDRMPEAFDKGYQEAMAFKDELGKLSLSTADYQEYVEQKQDARRTLRYGDNITVENIVINNNTHYSDDLLEKRLGLEEGEQYKIAQVEDSVQSLYALDRFELVTYRYDEVDGQDSLIFDVNEKSWGPNYLNFRFFLEDDFSTDSQYSLGTSANFTNLNEHGAELRANFEIGTDKRIEFEFYSPFLSTQKSFTTLGFSYNNEKRNAPVTGFEDTSLEATENYLPVSYHEWAAEWAIGYQDTLWRRFMIGARYVDGEGELSTLPLYGDVAFTRLGAFASYRIDTLDNYSLPTKGVYLDLDYMVSHDKSVGETEFVDQQREEDTSYEFGAKLIAAHTFSRHTLVANAELGFVTSKNSSVPIDPKEIGGFLNLSGIPRNSLIGENKAFGSLIYRYRWFDNDFGLFTSPFYVGSSLEYGGVWSGQDTDLGDAPLYVAGSVFAGVDSPIGPIMFGYGRTEQNYDSIYLIIGTTFK